MNLLIDSDFKNICNQIINENKSIQEWSLIESDDYFQTESYVGGFDSTEQAFCFSYYDNDHNEYWFHVTIDDVKKIVNEEQKYLNIINPITK